MKQTEFENMKDDTKKRGACMEKKSSNMTRFVSRPIKTNSSVPRTIRRRNPKAVLFESLIVKQKITGKVFVIKLLESHPEPSP